jgi:transmembrane sensor
VIAAALGSTWYLWPTGPAYRTEVGGLAAVPLTDGSKVALNTDSEIRVALDEKERHIYLKRGEAFFEVAKDPNRPFIVQVGNKRVIAVGTKFSVRYLPSAHTLIGGDGDDTRVLVAEGTVRMEGVRDPQASGLSTQHSVLTVGTIARALDDAFLVEENRSVEIERNLTWRAGQLTFRDTPLADAVAEFNRYNARKIVIEDASVAALQVGGIFRATNIDPFVRLIEQAFPIQVREEDDRIILTAAK